MQSRCCTRRAISAKAETPCSINLDSAGPLRAQKDGARGSRNRFPKHFKSFELVELFCLSFVPKVPGRKALEKMTGEAWESLFRSSDCLRTKSMDLSRRRRCQKRDCFKAKGLNSCGKMIREWWMNK
jgi:hypothetical protein